MLYLAASCFTAIPGSGVLRATGLLGATVLAFMLAYDALWLALVSERGPKSAWWL
jgi:hypothetical protein